MKNRRVYVLLLTSLLTLSSCSETTSSLEGSSSETSSTETSSVATSSSVASSSENHSVDLTLGAAPTYAEPSVSIHYWRKDGLYTGWDLWLWEVGQSGAAFAFNGKDDWGVVAAYPLSTWTDALTNSLGFLIRQGGDSWTKKDCGGNDLFIDFSIYSKDENDIYNVYLITGDANVYTDTHGGMKGKIQMATFTTTSRVALRTNLPMTSYVLKKGDEVLVTNEDAGRVIYKQIDLPTGTTVDFGKAYSVTVTVSNGDVLSSAVSKTLIYGSAEFGNTYNYDGPLGAIYSSESTTFNVWSPSSSTILLKIYGNGTPSTYTGGNDLATTYEMTKGDKGLFSTTVNGDLAGKYYTYVVTNDVYTAKETVDPYARSCGVNGLRGMIVDFSKTNPTGWDFVSPLQYDRKQLTVYETHVADITSSATWGGTPSKAKLFTGAYEAGTTYSEGTTTVATGFDHIKELGVNAVQLIPVYDQANDETNMSFNWGYNPLNYNCLEGGYSSDPYDGYARIKEFKELVQAYNASDINIIMDVVYNHVAGATGSNFDVLMPGYYFRYTGSMALSNGSGCGNETASENHMMRRFIVDSATFWAQEYKLGGFRFDLMGLHDLDTMAAVATSCKAVNPSICIYGEPWTGGTSTLAAAKAATQSNGNLYSGYGAFNDQMRDALIKGGLNTKESVGWITDATSGIQGSDVNKLVSGIKGTTSASVIIADPDKTVNYVTCHDNYTLYDRAIATGKFTVADGAALEKMNVLANSVVFTSQGTSFMLAGEEMLRTKGGNNNSYNASYAVNELDYSLLIDHPAMFESYKKMIALKKGLDGLHLAKEAASTLAVTLSADKSTLSYELTDTADNRLYKVVHVNGLGTSSTYDLSGYTLYWSTIDGGNKALTNATTLSQYETLIAYRSL